MRNLVLSISKWNIKKPLNLQIQVSKHNLKNIRYTKLRDLDQRNVLYMDICHGDNIDVLGSNQAYCNLLTAYSVQNPKILLQSSIFKIIKRELSYKLLGQFSFNLIHGFMSFLFLGLLLYNETSDLRKVLQRDIHQGPDS